MRTDLRYTPTDCFETFPFPQSLPSLIEQVGERYRTHRERLMQARREGLTKTYNRFHDKDVGQGAWHAGEGEFAGECDSDDAVVWLRGLHKAMDETVASAYGWPILVNGRVIEPATPSATRPKPLDLQHGFHQTKQGVRFTISEAARIEVLGRLLTLNHERYEDEKRRGLHAEKKPAKGKKAKAGGGGLFE